MPRPQLRACSQCKKNGHNSSTCPERFSFQDSTSPAQTTSTTDASPATVAPAKPPAAPVKFFVHHVAFESKHSPHVINLKKESFNVWDTVEAIAPQEPSTLEDHLFAARSSAPIAPPPTTERLPLHIESSPATKPIMLDTTNETSPTILDKKTISIPIPTVRLNVLGKKLRTAARARIEKIREHTRTGNHHTLSIGSSPSFTPRHIMEDQKKQTVSIPITPATTPPMVVPPAAPAAPAPTDTYPRKAFISLNSWRPRLALGLAFLLIISIIPLQAHSYYQSLQSTKASLVEKSTAGFLALQESTGALLNANLGAAQEGAVRALQSFAGARALMDDHTILQTLISIVPVIGEEVSSRQELIKAGQSISLGNTYLLKGVEASLQKDESTLIDKLGTVLLHVRAALPHYQSARTSLERIKTEQLPVEYQETFTTFKKLFISATHDFEHLADLGSTFQELFGGKGQRRYLLIFQNPAEIRATGGFVGSFAEVDVKDGRIVRFVVPPGGSYDVQGQLRAHIEPPTPLLMANKRWEFQDANWFPDFPTSAEKLLWFYRHSDRGGVDGIIALNATVLERLLSIIGPMTDTKRGVTLDNQNALTTLQAIVEEGEEKKERRPKQILSDFSHLFLNYFSSLSPKDLLPTLLSLKEALDHKEIQLYVADAESQKKIAGFGWSGSIIPTSPEQDYLLVVNSNIQGEKSDAKIKQNISHQTVIADDGSIINTVTVTREHTGRPGEKFYGKPNINYVRIYVPKGSQLIEAKGFSWPDEKNFRAPDRWTKPDHTLESIENVVGFDEKTGTRITEEFGKYSFGNWMVTEPGKIAQIQIVYRLPFTLSSLVRTSEPNRTFLNNLIESKTTVSTYQLVAQRQSGVESSFDSSVIFPNGWTPVWKDGDTIDVARNGATIQIPTLDHDRVWSLAMKKL